MTIFNKINVALSLSIICAFSAINTSAQTIGVNASKYSLLPETMVSPPDQTPNIMLILDTSGSMRDDSSDFAVLPGGANEPTSRSARVRAGIIAALKEIKDANISINISLATFGNKGLKSSKYYLWGYGSEIKNCHGYVLNCKKNQPRAHHIYARKMSGLGTILSDLAPLNSARMNMIETLFAREPRLPTFKGSSSNSLIVDSYHGYFEVAEGTNTTTDNGNLLYNGTLISQGGTPLRGSLVTAGKFFTQKPSAPSGYELPSNGSIVLPDPLSKIVAGASKECRPNSYIFLLTDGVPSTNPDGKLVSNVSDEVDLVATEARKLRNSYGIQTWVFGFELHNAAKGYMKTIAKGGSATQEAFLSNSTDALKTQIINAITAIDQTTASSSGISVVASQSEGSGLVVQALYDPKIEREVSVPDGSGGTVIEEQQVSWTGSLNGVFVDDLGFLREDSDGDGALDDYSVDNAFRMAFNAGTQQVDVERLAIAADGTETVTETVTLNDLKSIWDADEVLKSYSDNSVYGSKQRPYTRVASDGDGYRHIFSWMAKDPNDLESLHVGSQLDFMFNDDTTSKSINAKNFLMLAPRSTDTLDQKREVSEIIRFIRGEEGITGLRNRSLGTESFLLGDIVHSNATQVGTPNSNFDIQNDDSYTAFKERYKDRRRMLYVGANDGMLHGFNAGFWDPANKQFHQSPHVPGEIGAAHALGAEIWAYTPMNLLPHLKFLTESSYASNVHVAYMDGPVQSFDVRAWDKNDSVHENGWGTIIVAGMRFGGGSYTDLDWDAVDNTNSLYTSRSGYVILDVTNPEKQPKVIAEVIHPDMGFSLSTPTVSRSNCVADSDGDLSCDWHLIIGSGPTELSSSISTQVPRIFQYKLDHTDWGFEKYTISAGVTEKFKSFGSDHAFTGDLSVVDWNSDYEHDVVYFGSSSGTELAATGGVHRFHLNGKNANSITSLVDTDRPVPYRPITRQQAGKSWVMFGTGRFLTINDSTNNERNWFYNVIEPRDADGNLTYPTSLNKTTKLVDVTDIEVSSVDGSLSSKIEGAETFDELKTTILDSSSAKNRGWRKKLIATGNSANPSRKVSASALTFRNFLFYTDYLPPVSDGNSCTNEFGTSFLNVVDIATGTASYVKSPDFSGPLGVEAGPDANISTSIILGDGYASQSFLFPRKNPKTGKSEVLIKTPLSTGAIKDSVLALPPQLGGRTSWRELEIQ